MPRIHGNITSTLGLGLGLSMSHFHSITRFLRLVPLRCTSTSSRSGYTMLVMRGGDSLIQFEAWRTCCFYPTFSDRNITTNPQIRSGPCPPPHILPQNFTSVELNTTLNVITNSPTAMIRVNTVITSLITTKWRCSLPAKLTEEERKPQSSPR